MAIAIRETIDETYRPEPDAEEKQEGLYVIWYKAGERWSMLDVSEMYEMRSRILARAQGAADDRRAMSETYYTVAYTPRSSRQASIEIEQRQWLPTGTCGTKN